MKTLIIAILITIISFTASAKPTGTLKESAVVCASTYDLLKVMSLGELGSCFMTNQPLTVTILDDTEYAGMTQFHFNGADMWTFRKNIK
ncbi:MAG: hypothetical protein MJK15_02475 [Colwellia sp.]|nr:hypothetical protein [Colwellia sp.]